ncbi:MAG TPA: methionine biosynthesis protein MetW, partial [Thermoleophilia bacterium]
TVAVLHEALRVGQYVVGSFPNFGHWKARLQLLLTGKAPVTSSLPYQWYNTPNIHSLSIKDFRQFTREQGIRIVKHFYVGKKGRIRFWPNLRAEYGVFVLENLTPPGDELPVQ